jgi:hypothetical protein
MKKCKASKPNELLISIMIKQSLCVFVSNSSLNISVSIFNISRLLFIELHIFFFQVIYRWGVIRVGIYNYKNKRVN